MKLLFVLLSMLVLSSSETLTCAVCPRIPKCPKELFSDSAIDSIYRTLIQKVKTGSYPQELTKQSN